jgi:hypothetical protein
MQLAFGSHEPDIGERSSADASGIPRRDGIAALQISDD